MARPKKQEVDYFPHYCDHGKVLFILENHFKNDGYAVFYKLEELLSKTEGHCYDCSRLENWEYLLSRMGTTEEIVTGIIEKLSAMAVIDAPLWKEKRIWMQSFMDSISDAYARRKVDLPSKPELLSTSIPLSGINVNINPQSKVKESKVKKTYSVDFEIFYKAYPKKKARDEAWKAWQNRNSNRPEIEIILKAITAQSQSDQWNKESGQFIPNPATWINRGQWADEIEVKQNHTLSKKHQSRTLFKICPKCKEEYLETDIIDVGGKMYCPKCPEARSSFSGGNRKVSDLIKGLGG